MTHEEEKQKALEVEQKQITDATRLREFLADPIVGDAIRRVEKKYLADFHDADTDDKRRNAWACTRGLTNLVDELNATLSSGQLAQHGRNIRTAAEGRDAARTPRK